MYQDTLTYIANNPIGNADTLLVQNFKNTLVGESTNPITLTPINSPTFTSDRYGNLLSARSYTGMQYDRWTNIEELDVYTISGHFKVNMNAADFSFLINNSIKRLAGAGLSLQGTVFIQFYSTINQISIGWGNDGINKIYGGKIDFNPNISNFISLSVDSINHTIKLILNGKDVTSQIDDSSVFYENDQTKGESFPLAVIEHGTGFANVNSQLILNDVNVYKYLRNPEQIKAEFKKYPSI